MALSQSVLSELLDAFRVGGRGILQIICGCRVRVGVRGVSLGCFLHVICGQRVVAMGVVSVLGSLFIVAMAVVLCGLLVVSGGCLVVLGRLGVVLCRWVCRHLVDSCPVSGAAVSGASLGASKKIIIPTCPKGKRTVYPRRTLTTLPQSGPKAPRPAPVVAGQPGAFDRFF